MRLAPPVFLAAAALLATAATARTGDAEADLATLLKGRTAGPPVSCIQLRPTIRSRVVGNAIVYQDGARTWYVNRPDGGTCTVLRPHRTIINRTPGTQLCRGDIIQVADLPGGAEYGGCGLDSFTPYRKVK